MAPKIELVQEDGGKFLFHFKDREGQVRLTSLAYDGKIAAQTDVARLRKWLADDQHVVRHARPNGEFFITVKNDRGEVVARSPFAHSEGALDALVTGLRADAGSAMLSDQTDSRRRVGAR